MKGIANSARIRRADMDMRYLGKAWRLGFCGPSQNPQQTRIWQQIIQQIRSLPIFVDEERADYLHSRWLALFVTDAYSATLLKVHYRDYVPFDDSELNGALDKFSRV